MKAAVVATGAVGSATAETPKVAGVTKALCLAERGGTCREIAHGGTADLRCAAPLSPTAGIRSGGSADLAGAALVRRVGQGRPGPV
ncbi:hypothetical protein [Streptomyces sp. NPDC004629]|uniref:hypothetical protein n=1 Tax=Streptomyces sp. NPDC004629 TaxID=3364705 RepID=UPI00368BF4DA